MPDKIIDIVNKCNPIFSGAILAMIISIMRILYDRSEKKPLRIILEASLCGALSLAVSSAIMALDINLNWAIFCGGAIGSMGPGAVRALAIKIIGARLSK